MEVRILVNDKNTLELELKGSDPSLAQLIAERLNQEKDVEFAASKLEHPLVGSPKLYVKTIKGDASKLVLEIIDKIKKEVTEFRDEFVDIVK